MWHQCLSTKTRDRSFDLLEWTTALPNVFLLLYEMLQKLQKHGPWTNHDVHTHCQKKNNGNWHNACAHLSPPSIHGPKRTGRFYSSMTDCVQWCWEKIWHRLILVKARGGGGGWGGRHSNVRMGYQALPKIHMKRIFFHSPALYMRNVNRVSNLCKIGLKGCVFVCLLVCFFLRSCIFRVVFIPNLHKRVWFLEIVLI